MSAKHLFLVILFSIVVVFTYNLIKPKALINDSTEYIHLSENLLNNHLHYAGNLNQPADYRLFSKRTFGYPLFIALQSSYVFLLIAQCFLYILLLILGFKIGSELFGTRRFIKSYLLLILLSPLILFHTQFVLSDLLLAVIVLLALVVGFEKRVLLQSKINLIVILWTVALLVKPVVLPTLILLPIVAAYLKFKLKKKVLFMLLPLFVWFSISVTNFKTTGVFEYSSISTINLAHYNAKLTIASKYGNDSAQQFTSSSVFETPRNKRVYPIYVSDLNTLATTAIRENLLTYIKIQLAGMIKMLLDPGRWELYTYFNENTADSSLTELLFSGQFNELNNQLSTNPTLLVLFLLLLIINILKLAGMVMGAFRPTKVWFIIVIICGYFLTITGPIGAARFMVPATILSILLSIYGWKTALDFFQKRSKS